jgi:hypothetical protein
MHTGHQMEHDLQRPQPAENKVIADFCAVDGQSSVRHFGATPKCRRQSAFAWRDWRFLALSLAFWSPHLCCRLVTGVHSLVDASVPDARRRTSAIAGESSVFAIMLSIASDFYFCVGFNGGSESGISTVMGEWSDNGSSGASFNSCSVCAKCGANL